MEGLHRPEGTSVSTGQASNLSMPANDEIASTWASKTSAVLLSQEEFTKLKEREGLHIVGVTGFSGQWSEAKIAADEGIRSDVGAATAAITEYLTELKAAHGDKLVLSSGATMEGVPKIIYDLCEKMGITAMGVTSAKAIDYPLGKMSYLIVHGSDWGEESPIFLATSDELLMVGGGGQAKREAIAASTEGKPLTVLQGYKGTADQLTQEDVPNAKFVMRH